MQECIWGVQHCAATSGLVVFWQLQEQTRTRKRCGWVKGCMYHKMPAHQYASNVPMACNRAL